MERVATVRLGVVSDLHFSLRPLERVAWHGPFDAEGVLARLDTALSWFAYELVDAVAVLGDLTHHGDASSMLAVLAALADGSPAPIFVLPGNHDVLEHPETLARAAEQLGAPGVDIATPAGARLGDLTIAGPRPLAVDSTGPLVVLSHFSVLSRSKQFAARGLAYAGDAPDRAATAAGLAEHHGPVLVLNGHLHARDTHAEGNVLQMTVGAMVEAPFEMTIIEIGIAGATLTARRTANELRPGPAISPAREEASVSSANTVIA